MEIRLSRIERFIRGRIQRYNHEKYWRYREKLVDPECGNLITDCFRLIYIKRSDAFNNASMGTHRNFGAKFAEPPQLPHGIYGIIVSHNAVIGKNVRILHQVTIGEGRGGAPVIGNDVVIGAGSKITGGVRIGDHVRIGAGCVIMQDIPDNSIVLAPEPVVRIRQER